jgi:DNA-binding beta-propeller fold protein YncE
MTSRIRTGFATFASMLAVGLVTGSVSGAELLGVMTYESKPGEQERKEGIAIMELDLSSPRFGQIIKDIPLPPDLVAHHMYHSPDNTKVYITALGRPELRIMDVKSHEVKVISVPDCQVGENVAFSEKKAQWYLTCMGSSVMIVGDLKTDQPLRTVQLPAKYPHGIAVHDGIGRILLTSTVRASDLQDPGEVIQELDLETEKPMGTHKIGSKPGSAPVEVVFIPNSNPPRAYTTAMYDGSLWLGSWNPETKQFSWKEVLDFKPVGQALPLEVYFNDKGDRAYVSTAKPGHLNVYDISNPETPKLLHSVATAGGAHHMVFSPGYKHAYVQNSFINLPDMHDGTISVVDLETGKVIRSIDTLKEKGFTPNNISLLLGGHTH